MTQSNFLYLRGLRQVDHTVFSVANGQKTYFEPRFRQQLPYSSGQQVKRSILDHLTDLLGVGRAPVEFRYKFDKTGKSIGEDIAILPLNPKYVDELIGGYMFAEGKQDKDKKKKVKQSDVEESIEGESGDKSESGQMLGVIKRRSPLSISAMRPLHPLLAGTHREESITFDRTGDAKSKVSLLDQNGNPMSLADMESYLRENDKYLRKAKFVDARNAKRVYGLYIYDVAIDLRRLFSVSIDVTEPEVSPKIQTELRQLGWKESNNAFGKSLIAPEKERLKIIPALTSALLEWQIKSNQSRTYNPQSPLAIAIGDKPYHVTGAIRADLIFDETEKALPILDDRIGAQLYVTVDANGQILGSNGRPDALQMAQEDLSKRLLEYAYEAEQV